MAWSTDGIWSGSAVSGCAGPAGSIFYDSFETNDFSLWTSTTGDATTQNTIVYSDLYAAAFLEDATTTNAVHARKTLAAIDDVYTRAYMRYSVLPDVGMANYGLCLMDAATNLLSYAAIINVAGIGYWANNNDVTDRVCVAGQWYCVEVYYHRGAADAHITMWIDGVLENDRGTIASDFAAGILQIGADAGVGASDHDVTAYFDCVVVNAAYIGL